MDLQVLPKSRGEQPVLYRPGSVPDMAPFNQHVSDTLLSMQELDAQQVRIDEKAEAARAKILAKSAAQRACDLLTSEISKVEVLAFVNDDGADVRELERKLAEAKKHLKAATSEATAAEGAIVILKEKSGKNSDLMEVLRGRLSEAERKWLGARQDTLFEEFRQRFHDLHDTVAMLLALEIHPSFDNPDSIVRYRAGSDLLDRLATALPYNGPRNYTPTWVHVSNRFEFPGFSAAQKKLAEELSQTRPSSETEK